MFKPGDQTTADAFVKANNRSLVVSGYAHGNGGEGGTYTLANGKSFSLSRDACRALPAGYPKWKGL